MQKEGVTVAQNNFQLQFPQSITEINSNIFCIQEGCHGKEKYGVVSNNRTFRLYRYVLLSILLFTSLTSSFHQHYFLCLLYPYSSHTPYHMPIKPQVNPCMTPQRSCTVNSTPTNSECGESYAVSEAKTAGQRSSCSGTDLNTDVGFSTMQQKKTCNVKMAQF